MTCETVAELLLDYLEGGLSSEQTQSIEAHLRECPACAARLRETRAVVGDLDAARSVDQRAWNSGADHPRGPDASALEKHAVLGDFEILGELGRGGMGVVYRARQVSLNRIVALKVLSPGLVRSERSISRFAREAQAAARLHHTNIVPIYAQGHEQGHFYYAMELIEGESLDQILRRHREARGAAATEGRGGLARRTTRRLGSPVRLLRSAASTVRLRRGLYGHRPVSDYKRTARLIAGVAEGLHHAHEQGVIHRDIKPQNLMLGRDDELHITDFGLARLLDEPGLTLSTELVGTPAYMAPEQIAGGGQAIDRRTDVYALGVTLYELLTLERPFEAEAYEQTIAQILNREPTPPRKLDPQIPVDLETICLRAIEKEPQRRFPTAAELARDLRRYAEDYPIVSRRVGPLGKAARWVRRHPARTAAIAATGLVAILAPLLAGSIRAMGNAQIERAVNVLLNDYRDKDRALTELGWASRLFGDDYRRDFAAAFAYVRTEPERSIGILQNLVAEHPDDRDAHYLLAWAYARRVQPHGTEMWADAQRHITLADALPVEPSAAGWFFRGQAVWGLDPRDAERTFDQAIDARDNFTQAMLHQGRAMNQIMYSLRDVGYYEKAVTRLGFVVRSQSAKAYPRYLLSITHLLAAEIYRAQGKDDKANEAYEASLRLAREAQQVEPSSPRGYAAEADYHESRGDYRSAIDSWNAFDRPSVRKSASDCSERFAYQMRLHFWLGECDKAREMWAGRYGEQSGYDGDRGYDADETLYEVLIAASAGKRGTVDSALASAVARARGRPEYLLRLDTAYRLLGRAPPLDLLPREAPPRSKLSPGWTAEWLQTLIRYERGEIGWEGVVAASTAGTHRKDDPRLRMAGAYFFRAVRELAAGHRERAVEALDAACRQYDNENYCFRAKFLLSKLESNPAWPNWLTESAAETP